MKVLFVCVGNSCRSQIAEALFNQVSKTANASSAGTKPTPSVNPFAVQVMKEVGIDIAKARPKLLTSEMLATADKVITMGCAVGDVCPGAIAGAKDWGIEDPIGKPIEEFRKVRDITREKVKKLVKMLEPSSSE